MKAGPLNRERSPLEVLRHTLSRKSSFQVRKRA